MPKQAHKPLPHFFSRPQLNLSQADLAAYEKYKRWCEALGIEPASPTLYLGRNRRESRQNNIDMILMG